MYRWVSWFMSYRSFYVWRARYRYYTRHLDAWMLASALCLMGVVALLWYYWRFTSAPPPRMHPQAAALRVEGITNEAIHRIVLVRHGGTTPGKAFTTPEEIRASTVRTMRVRQVLDGEAVWRLKASLLTDIAEYIDATDGCVPYRCERVQERIAFLREAAEENAGVNRALQAILDEPLDLLPNLEDSERQRVKSGWSDSFDDIYHQTWLLNDLQRMHARMMAEYPRRAPVSWLPKWMTGSTPEPRNGTPL